MKIADYLRLQRDFDRFVMCSWRMGAKKCLNTCAGFLDRAGIELDGEGTVVQQIEAGMRKAHLTRRPDLNTSWFNMSIGTWLFHAYPELFDRIAATDDARTINLAELRYVKNPPLPKASNHPLGKKIREDEQRKNVQMGMLSYQSNGRHSQIRGRSRT